MTTIVLTDLSDKQRDAWRMRYRYGWHMKRIALELGSKESAVSRLLLRAQRRAGLPPTRNVSLRCAKPRQARTQSLSGVYDY
ncbi:MAG TPA: hypothetical protein VFC78_21565 [Tepidisphaeraceae bacterium]|nr:hypothetical protein [Tepidisphaeraceae bacterium]